LLLYLGLFRAALLEGGGGRLLGVAAVAALALGGGLAAACFVKVFGVVFLGEPRSEAVARAGEAPRAMLAPMAALAAACAVLGLAPWLALPALEAALASFDPALAAAPRLGALAPFAALSLAGLALLAAVAGVWTLVAGRRLRAARRAVTWDCGYAAPSPRMQYTASSFADGLVSLFRWALRPEVAAPRLGRVPFPPPARFESELPDPVLDRLVLPAARGLARASLWFRWLQRGRLHAYVLYVLIAVVLGLLAARGGLG
jgi:hydrogenase-4 component B